MNNRATGDKLSFLHEANLISRSFIRLSIVHVLERVSLEPPDNLIQLINRYFFFNCHTTLPGTFMFV